MRICWIVWGLILFTSSLQAQEWQKLEQLWQQGEKQGRVGIALWSLSNQEWCFRRRSEELFPPASTMKILTAVAAYEFLRPSYTFGTFFYATDRVRKGRLKGSLWIVGEGDPNLSGRFYSSPQELLRSWAKRLYALGIRTIEKDLVLDDRFFDRQRYHPDWEKEDAQYWYGAPVSALAYNDNCVDLRLVWRRGKVRVARLQPNTGGWLRIVPRVRRGLGGVRTVARGDHTIALEGSVPPKGLSLSAPVPRPVLFFGHALQQALKDQGIRLDGKVRLVSDGEVLPPKAQLLFVHQSSLQVALAIILKRSQNLHSEMVFKTLGKRLYGQGTFRHGRLALEKLLKKAQISHNFVLRDGSGLSRKNRLSPQGLARLLCWVWERPYRDAFLQNLSVSSIDGTLRRRLRNPLLYGNVYAKTGSLRKVSTLAGYLWHPRRKGWYVFVIFCEGIARARARVLQDKMLQTIVQE